MQDKIYVPSYGPFGAKLMILGDCPTDSDVSALKPFTGNPGKELGAICRDAHININDCWLSTVSKYYVRPNNPKEKIPFAIRAKQSGVNIDSQLQELQNEISSIKPNCILALSGTALWALSGKSPIGKFRGSILHGMGNKFVPSYHPRDLYQYTTGGEIKGYWNRQVMIFDFKRALYQSQFPEIKRPIRNLQICKSSYELNEFLQKYKDVNRGAVDIEANGTCIPVCVGLSFNKNHGLCLPLWNVDGISSIPDSDLVQCWILLAKRLFEMDVVGQNFNYDRDKLLRLGFRIGRLTSDVMIKAFSINPELPKSLSFNTSIYTEEPYYKDEGMYEGSIQDLFIGCARDACVTLEVDENMDSDINELGQRAYFNNFLMELPDLYWAIERQGFKVNGVERDKLLRKYITWDEKLRYRLFQLTGTEINVNSPKQIASLLWDNLKLPRKSSTGEEDITELLNSPTAIKTDEHREICELILEDRRVRKSIGTYLMALPDFDGRMKTSYFPCLETGRSSTSKQGEPQRPKIEVINEDGKKVKKELGIAFQTMTKHGDIGADIRGQYIPDSDDEIFVQADSSQAEARVVWLLAEDYDALRMVDEIDYHALTATWFFGKNKELHDYDKKVLGYEHPIRFAGKTLRHAGHLGAGKRRASIEVNTQARKYKIPIHISEQVAERALRVFHSKQPKIQQVFQSSVIECLKKDRKLIAPIPYGVDADLGPVRIFYERYGEELFRQGFSYIPQRTVTDNTKAAGIRIRNRIPGIKIVMESHDALLFCILKSKVNEYSYVIKEEFERPIDFSKCSLPRRELVIPCEIETGMNYRDFHKFKFDIPIIAKPKVELEMSTKSITEQFLVDTLPPDTKFDNLIYESQNRTNS